MMLCCIVLAAPALAQQMNPSQEAGHYAGAEAARTSSTDPGFELPPLVHTYATEAPADEAGSGRPGVSASVNGGWGGWGGWGGSRCVNYSSERLRSFAYVKGGTAVIDIPRDACPVTVSFTSYRLPGGKTRPFEDQRVHDNVTKYNLGAGRHTLKVDLPNCAWQTDIYLGEVIERLNPKYGHPGDRLIAWDYKEGARCTKPDPTPICRNVSKQDLINAGTRIEGGLATIVVPSGACDVKISVSSYELPGGDIRPFEDQILFDNVTNTYGPGKHKVSVDLPECNWQSDVYLGDVVKKLTPNVGHPPERILAWDYDAKNVCDECVAAAEPTMVWDVDEATGTVTLVVSDPTGIETVDFVPTNMTPDAGKTDFTPGATTATFVFTATDLGQNYSVAATATNECGKSTSQTRGGTGDPCIHDTGAPTITFSRVGNVITAVVEDDTQLAEVALELTNVVQTGGTFNPGDKTVTYTFEIADVSQDAGVKIEAKDGCGKSADKTETVPGDPCILDQGAPQIDFDVVQDGSSYLVVVKVTDDTEITSVTYVPDPNLEEVSRTETAKEVVIRLRIIDTRLNSVLKVQATDACSKQACDDDNAPVIAFVNKVEQVFDEHGQPVPDPNNPGYSLYIDGRGTATDDVGILKMGFFALDNMRIVLYDDADLGQQEVTYAIQLVNPSVGGRHGAFAADACNAFILDPFNDMREGGMPAKPAFVETDGLVVMEAESFTGSAAGTGRASGHAWTAVSNGQASGGTAMQALPKNGLNVGDSADGPRLDFDVEFSTPGTYYVWVRLKTTGWGTTSAHAGLDGVPASYGRGGIASVGLWVWNNVVLFRSGDARVSVKVPAAGRHTVNVWMREAGVEVDKVILSADARFSPRDDGPAESMKSTPMLSARRGLADAGATQARVDLGAGKVEAAEALPTRFALGQNYPNPFNPQTTISFDLPSSAPVRLSVYDVLGREVKVLVDGELAAGTHRVAFDGSGVASGTYLYRLVTPQQTFVRTMVLMK